MEHSPQNPSLGVRNCNPGNILATDAYTWRGQDGRDSFGHCKFIDPVYGLRAICITILNYGEHGNCRTVSDYIGRWSTGIMGGDPAYEAYVASCLDMTPEEYIDPHARALPLLKAIVHYENGYDPYPYSLLARGITAAHAR